MEDSEAEDSRTKESDRYEDCDKILQIIDYPYISCNLKVTKFSCKQSAITSFYHFYNIHTGNWYNNMSVCKRRCLEASQLTTNHYYLERKKMLSVNEWMKLSFGHVQVGHVQIVRWKSGSPDGQETIMR